MGMNVTITLYNFRDAVYNKQWEFNYGRSITLVYLNAGFEGSDIAETTCVTCTVCYVIFFCNERYLHNPHESWKKHFIVHIIIFTSFFEQINRNWYCKM